MIETLTGALVEVATDNDRELSVARPSRSVSAVRDASRVPARWRAFAECVLHRESGATLDRRQSGAGALNSSNHAGRWQFATDWRHGLPYMVRDRLVRHGLDNRQARTVRLWLTAHPIQQWPGLYQDMGAFEVMERGGAWHWKLAGSRCEAYR